MTLLSKTRRASLDLRPLASAIFQFHHTAFLCTAARLQVDNLFHAQQQVADSQKGKDTYYLVLPGRSWFASVSLVL